MSDRFDHDLVCNGARNQPIGASGHGCSCLGRLQRDRERLSGVEAELKVALKQVAVLEEMAIACGESYEHYIDSGGKEFGNVTATWAWIREGMKLIAERRAGRES